MQRRIYFDPPSTKATSFAAAKGEKTKDALAKIAQLIPGEILGGYGAALATIPLFAAAQQPWIALGCFVLGILGTGWYVGWQIGKRISKQKHVVIYMTSFAIWAYSLTGKTALPWIYHPGVAALLPIVASVIFARIKLPKREVR